MYFPLVKFVFQNFEFYLWHHSISVNAKLYLNMLYKYNLVLNNTQLNVAKEIIY